MYTLVNELSNNPINSSIGYSNSWLQVKNNAQRELFAQASYITNFDDLNINLSTSNINIGNVKLSDANTGLIADIVDIGMGSGALRVITQDLESTEDDITIGDRNGNFAVVNKQFSALNVYITNPNIVNIPYSYTLCETREQGNPSFISKQIILHNKFNIDTEVILTLTSGLTCSIPMFKTSSSTLNLAVSTVNNYNGCVINFFA